MAASAFQSRYTGGFFFGAAMPAAQLKFSGVQMRGADDRVLPNARLYVYLGGTTTPISAYVAKDLAVPLSWPVLANGAGRFPPIWIDDEPETARVRVTSATGLLIYEDPDEPVIGPTRWAASVTPDVDPLRLMPTGMEFWLGVALSLPGTVRGNGRTIGNASSGATERANADCEALFKLYWADATYTVSGGRGSSADDDWAANKTITLPNQRGRSHIGVDGMGNSNAGVLTGITAPNMLGGAETHTLSLAQIPNHNHGGATGPNGAHSHTVTIPQVTVSQGAAGGGAFFYNSTTGSTSTEPDHSHSIAAQGSGSAHNNLHPYRTAYLLIKL